MRDEGKGEKNPEAGLREWDTGGGASGFGDRGDGIDRAGVNSGKRVAGGRGLELKKVGIDGCADGDGSPSPDEPGFITSGPTVGCSVVGGVVSVRVGGVPIATGSIPAGRCGKSTPRTGIRKHGRCPRVCDRIS